MDNLKKKFLIVGNWKMNLGPAEAAEFVKSLKRSAEEVRNIEIVLCPSFPCLESVFEEIEESDFEIGAQNMHFEEKGAFTGEVSALQLKPFCRYVILGHSERRAYFKETDEIVNKKILTGLKHSLIPIICIGESEEEREDDRTMEVVAKQVKAVLNGIARRHLPRLVFAYEPVWAIGTGKTPTPQDASSVCLYIRRILTEIYGREMAARTRILYGGSINGKNAAEFLGEPGVDGLLVGGASINLADFAKILREAGKISK